MDKNIEFHLIIVIQFTPNIWITLPTYSIVPDRSKAKPYNYYISLCAIRQLNVYNLIFTQHFLN